MDLNYLYQKFLSCSSVTTDSREVSKDALFFALQGENFNGNLYAGDALEKGAKYAVVDNENIADNTRFIRVDNALKTLQQLALFHRREMNAKVFGITGSNGKTTTKELIYQVLSKKHNTLTNIKNYNNHIGVPLTLLNLRQDHEIAVIEMGANHQGEIQFLCELAEPDYGLITNIGKAHLEGFGSFEGVIKTKSELYDFVSQRKGVIFYNSDNNLLESITQKYGCKKIRYGSKGDIACKGELEDMTPFLKISSKNTLFQTQLIGDYNFENILAAICTGFYFDVPVEDIKEAIESYQPVNNRSQIINTENNKIILDAYNANPTSMKAAIDNFATLKDKNKVLILGDMFELGEYSHEEHAAVVEQIKEHQFEEVFLIGKDFDSIQQNAFKTFYKTDEFTAYLKSHRLKNKTILIKGSRGMALEKVVNYL